MSVDLEFHPLANVFPLIAGEEFDALVASIRERGQLEQISTYEGQILDGRNRYLACRAAGVDPVSEAFDGSFLEARNHVIDANLRRRHLDTSQRAMIAAKLATLADGQRQVGKFAGLPTQAEAASILNVGERSVRSAREVLDDGAPELVAAVERGDISVSRAARIVSLPRAARIAEPKDDPDTPPGARHLRNQRIANPIVVPKVPSDESPAQRAARLFLFHAHGDLSVCDQIMREIGLELVEQSRLPELLSATNLVIAAWKKIAKRLG
jgi:ParB-like chromosome segregation protein Spo0J